MAHDKKEFSHENSKPHCKCKSLTIKSNPAYSHLNNYAGDNTSYVFDYNL